MTMCKHKSGGMGKAAAASHRPSNINNRAINTCPEQQGDHEATTAEQSQSSSTTDYQRPAEESYESAVNRTSDFNITHNGNNQTSYDLCDGATSLKYDNLSFPVHDSKSSESEDDDSTELSPMLIQNYVPSYPPQNSVYNSRYENGATNGVYSWREDNPQTTCSSISNGCLIDPRYELVNKSTQPRSYFTQDKERFFNFQAGYPSKTPYNVNGCYDYRSSEKRNPAETSCSRDSTLPCNNFPLLCMHSFDLVGSNVQENGESGQYSSNFSPSLEPMPGPSGLQRPSSVNWEIGTNEDKDDEFRCRSYSLTPTVNFAVFESESASEAEEEDTDTFLEEPTTQLKEKDQCKVAEDEQFRLPITTFHNVLPISPSAAQLSLASSYGENSGAPICKICHMTSKENDPLISPCRCSGTMQYIHCGCLMRWLEISSKRSRKPASCELCQYQYHWHKKFKVRHWQFPHCTRRDKVLHFLFFISIIVMVACATVTIMCFKQDKGTRVNPDRTELTNSEIITLVCGVAFFLAFFVAMYVEVKSRSTIYKLLVKFIYLNQQWYIDEYDKKLAAPVAV